MSDGERHPDGVYIDAALVRRLVATQFPRWADLPIRPVEVGGVDNKTFHLGARMTVRLPSAEGYILQVEKEQRWLPKLAPLLPRSPSLWQRGLRPTVIPGGGPSTGGSKVRPRPSGVSPIWSSSRQRSPTSSPPCIGSTPPVDRRPASTTSSCCGPLTVYDAETRQAIAALDGEIDTDAASAVWEAALAAEWHGPPVWFHGDIAWGNLLVEGGRLSAVIDFGTSGVGDPSCDLAIAWTLFGGESRNAFRAALQLGDATWARGRGWTLWKGLITLAEHLNTNPSEAENARRVIDEALADHRAE